MLRGGHLLPTDGDFVKVIRNGRLWGPFSQTPALLLLRRPSDRESNYKREDVKFRFVFNHFTGELLLHYTKDETGKWQFAGIEKIKARELWLDEPEIIEEEGQKFTEIMKPLFQVYGYTNPLEK